MYIVVVSILNMREGIVLGSEIDNAALLEIIKKLLKADMDLSFLLTLQEDDLKTLVGCIRGRMDQLSKQAQ